MGIELATGSADDTRDFGETLAGFLQPNDVVSLTGEPGAGKTTLVQGVGAGLGSPARVVSPTFTLVREYEGGRLHLFHLDVYRLNRIQDVLDLGVEDMLEGGGVTFIEWGDVIEGLLGRDYLEVELTLHDPGSEERAIRVTAVGVSWSEREKELAVAAEGWRS
jgi:tRNA threonylcarbamoyladenosine biosynthesis protein TsaE